MNFAFNNYQKHIQVLYGELVRNLGLAAAAVLVVTIVLVANLWTSLLVFVCVVFTVVSSTLYFVY